jgi:hypothetical protein
MDHGFLKIKERTAQSAQGVMAGGYEDISI